MSNINSYVIGQRWLNHADPALGLGIVTEITARSLNVIFPAVEDVRIYAIDKAPLTRIIYNVGDDIKTMDGLELKVTQVVNQSGLYLYEGLDSEGHSHQLFESKLYSSVNFTAPLKRLTSGQVDKARDYQLKIETLQLNARLLQSKSRGLIGARMEHLPHQIHIASEVAKRFAPRVLLADEVGLGKTIEAGLILHQQLITGRAKRLLIIVPDSLIHQWFVEMLRRFNLTFSIFNKERYQAIDEANPFETEQLIITSLDFLMGHADACQQAQEAPWDLVVVDEAHHLEWSEKKPSAEYATIEIFAAKSQGLLLLTATPEQLGLESHFARLRLLDPARYDSLSKFKKEQENFEAVSILSRALLHYKDNEGTEVISADLKEKAQVLLGAFETNSIPTVLSMLIDRHGTGRVLFRNTRAAISGFPERILHPYPLEKPAIYDYLISDDLQALMHPETLVPEDKWLSHDPRVAWLIDKVRALRPHKVLVIAANANSALALESHLRIKTSIRVAAFHEGLSIIERDRASAYFSDFEEGAECLICSEIGSEGRNFQFAHELILFDLPLIPDLLEQRIGRLDRIAQENDINIHVPFIQGLPTEALFRWYDDGINLFKQSCSFGYSLYQQFEASLENILTHLPINTAQLMVLIDDTKRQANTMRKQAEAGRDQLLELSSCNVVTASQLIADIEQEEAPETLKAYMNKVFNHYGVSHDSMSEGIDLLRPSEHMKSAYFPGLSDEGNRITYSRELALVREDVEFLSVEHPMVRDVIEMILNEPSGSVALSSMALPNLAPGTLLLEAFYSPQVLAPEQLTISRYLPLTPIRVFVDLQGNNLEKVISHEQLSGLCKNIKRQLVHPVIDQIKEHVEFMVENALMHAQKALPFIKASALEKMQQELGYEHSRLIELKKVNPSIRPEEIDFIQTQMQLSEKAINEASLTLEGIRVVINNG